MAADPTAPPPLPPNQPRLASLQAVDTFIANATPWQLAQRLRHDQALVRAGHLPTLLAQRLPARGELADEIAMRIMEVDSATFEKSVLGGTNGTRLPAVATRSVYRSVLDGIREYLGNIEGWQEELRALDHEESPAEQESSHLVPSTADYTAALKVLQYLTHAPELPSDQRLTASSPLSTITALIDSELALPSSIRAARRNIPPPPKPKQKRCYICRYTILLPHLLYPSLCHPCGIFNTTSAALSSPANLPTLTTKIALVTGARVNLGFYTTLHLLRCGAKVIATTRYPLDAERRYLEQPDAEKWKHRFRVVGADFRRAGDVFRMVTEVRGVCQQWDSANQGKLDILVNNAAQTLTDRVDEEAKAVRRERRLAGCPDAGHLLVGFGDATKPSYVPAVRGDPSQQLLLDSSSSSTTHQQQQQIQDLILPPIKSSWTQHLEEIPYEDLLSAHSVNAFVPLILMRELLPLLALPPRPSSSPSSSSSATPRLPNGYILNISSRESIPETSPTHSHKAGHHVHTNMSKAALNMLTETQAAECWQKHRVAVNSVDPGYMSADPMWMDRVFGDGAGGPRGRETDTADGNGEDDAPEYVYKGEKPLPGRETYDPRDSTPETSAHRTYQCPISWEDGVARVLFPVAMAEGKVVDVGEAVGKDRNEAKQGRKGGQGNRVLWGRFLRHFEEVDVNRWR